MKYVVEQHYNYGDMTNNDVTFYLFKGTEDELRMKMWKSLGLSDDDDVYQITNYGNIVSFAPKTNDIMGTIITAQPLDTIEEKGK